MTPIPPPNRHVWTCAPAREQSCSTVPCICWRVAGSGKRFSAISTKSDCVEAADIVTLQKQQIKLDTAFVSRIRSYEDSAWLIDYRAYTPDETVIWKPLGAKGNPPSFRTAASSVKPAILDDAAYIKNGKMDRAKMLQTVYNKDKILQCKCIIFTISPRKAVILPIL